MVCSRWLSLHSSVLITCLILVKAPIIKMRLISALAINYVQFYKTSFITKLLT